MITKFHIFIVYLLFTISCALPAKNSGPLNNSNIDTIGINEEVISNKKLQKRDATKSKSELKCDEYRNLCESSRVIHLIIGGSNVTQDEFPHMVALGSLDSDNTFKSVCGGTLISEQWVLTAAHCIGLTHSLLGTHDLTDTKSGTIIEIDDVVRYPSYNASYYNNDIALVKLSRKVSFNDHIRPACLYQTYDSSPREVTAAGWGSTEDEGTSSKLLKIRLDVVNNVECTQKYGTDQLIQDRLLYGIAPSMLCAVDKVKGKRDTCNGDSGGPIKIHLKGSCLHEVVGVTSFGELCLYGGDTRLLRPGVYTRVSHFLNWIEEVVWP